MCPMDGAKEAGMPTPSLHSQFTPRMCAKFGLGQFKRTAKQSTSFAESAQFQLHITNGLSHTHVHIYTPTWYRHAMIGPPSITRSVIEQLSLTPLNMGRSWLLSPISWSTLRWQWAIFSFSTSLSPSFTQHKWWGLRKGTTWHRWSIFSQIVCSFSWWPSSRTLFRFIGCFHSHETLAQNTKLWLHQFEKTSDISK